MVGLIGATASFAAGQPRWQPMLEAVPGVPQQQAAAKGTQRVLGVKWFRGDLEASIASAKQANQPIAVHFLPEWSEWSKHMVAKSIADEGVRMEMKHFVALNIDPQIESGAALVKRFGVRTFPSIVFLNADGQIEDLLAGYIPPRAYQRELNRIRNDKGTVSDLRRRSVVDPMDLQVRHELAQKLWDLGDDAGFRENMEFIKANDPAGISLPMRRITLWNHQEDIFGCRSNGGKVDLEPLVIFLASEKHDAVRYEGFTYLAGVYQQLGQPKESRDAYREAAKFVSDIDLPTWGSAVAGVFENQKEQLSKAEKSFALKFARKAASAAKRLDEDLIVRAECQVILAKCYAMMGKKELALKALQIAADLQPEEVELAKELEALRIQIS